MYKLVIDTIKNFVLQHKVIAVIICLLLGVSLLSVFLIASIVSGNIEQEKKSNQLLKQYSLVDTKNNFQAYEENPFLLEENLNNITKEMQRFCNLKYVRIINNSDPSDLDIDAYTMEYMYNDNDVYLGRDFTVKEFENKDKKIVVSNLRRSDILVGDKILVDETEYTVIGLSFELTHRIVYNNKIRLPIHEIQISLEDIPTEKINENVVDVLEKYFPNLSITEPVKTEKPSTGDTVLKFLFCSLFVLTLINIIFIYSYLLSLRKKNIIIMRVCGATKGKCVFLFLLEILIISTAVYIPTAFISRIVLPYLLKFTTSGNYEFALNASDYLTVLVIYIVTIIIVFLPFLLKAIKTEIIRTDS